MLQMNERFNDGQVAYVQALFVVSKVYELLLRSDIDPVESVEEMLYWENDLPFPKSFRMQ